MSDYNHSRHIQVEMLITGKLMVDGISDLGTISHKMGTFLLPFAQSSYQVFGKQIAVEILQRLITHPVHAREFEADGITESFLQGLLRESPNKDFNFTFS